MSSTDEPPAEGPAATPAREQGRSARGRALRWTFYAATAVAFGWFAWKVEWSQLDGVSVRWGWVAAATVVGVLFCYVGAFTWRVVLVGLGARELPPFRTLADVHAKAWLARYIPGTLPWIAGKVYLAAQLGIARSRLAVSALVEAAAQVVAAGTVSLLLLAVDPRIGEISPTLRVAVAIGALVGLGAMTPAVFNRILRLGFRLLRRGAPDPVDWPLVGRSLALYSGGAVVSGASFALLVFALAPEAWAGDLLFLTGAYGFAGVVGMLTPLVPSGLGTKDATLLVLLLIIVPAPTAALVVLVSRVWSAAVDVLFWAVAVSSERLRRIREERASADPA
ncbi:hypothetical protein [Demequina sp. NBRC 110052]|uniref:hypothetical protein n=1 Tax=Demequina sp. NBRC 110052 TaxID=1570341 RepID=UPI0009FE6F3A|nr:hypothetical protein [Demequina sp. NBRC 110052]